MLAMAIDIVQRGGWIMIPIFLAGWWAWFLLLDRSWLIWRRKGSAWQGFWKAVEQGGMDAGERWLQKANGIFAEMVREVLRVSDYGNDAVHHEIELVAIARSYELREHLRTINRLAALAPLLGLLGTVSGIVHTFSTITEYGFSNPALFANGISEALLATQSGLLVAIPISICYNWILKRIERLEVQSQAEAIRVAAWIENQTLARNLS